MASNILKDGYSVHTDALPLLLGQSLWDQSHDLSCNTFNHAGIGRDHGRHFDPDIRSDEIAWINDSEKTGLAWTTWMSELQACVNAKLFLGLFSFESHYAIFRPGGFYLRHSDAFRGDQNRILSITVYLNQDWQKIDAGELVLFVGRQSLDQIEIAPKFGTIVVFLSEEVPHEVRTTSKNRHSIAGWFHANRSTTRHVDPPR